MSELPATKEAVWHLRTAVENRSRGLPPPQRDKHHRYEVRHGGGQFAVLAVDSAPPRTGSPVTTFTR